MHLVLPALRDYLRHHLLAPYGEVTPDKPVRKIEMASDGMAADNLGALTTPAIFVWSPNGEEQPGKREGSTDELLRGTLLILWAHTTRDPAIIDPINSPFALKARVRALMGANKKLRLPWSEYSYMYPDGNIRPWLQDDTEPHNKNKCEGVADALNERLRWESFDLDDHEVTGQYSFYGVGLRLYFQYERIYIKTISRFNNVPVNDQSWS